MSGWEWLLFIGLMFSAGVNVFFVYKNMFGNSIEKMVAEFDMSKSAINKRRLWMVFDLVWLVLNVFGTIQTPTVGQALILIGWALVVWSDFFIRSYIKNNMRTK